ncbi:glycosyltransferase family 4 protein [Microbulbifer sp. Q7]|uniref:glycosyltransferase family 4 protein n=1 Tax=Microbulbifer sp. Q7 TaxID=1785091 RepID=UPI00082B7A67|nr:glycosyltransferase family 4 protein [Microbulbifer sp. Q7]
MRICFLHPKPNYSGGCRVVAIYAEGLAALGHEVSIVCGFGEPKTKNPIKWLSGILRRRERKDYVENSHFSNLEKVRVKLLPGNDRLRDRHVPDADVVIATWWKTADWAYGFSKRKGKKFYFVQHHETHPHFPREKVEASYRYPLTKIVIANWLANVMAKKYGDANVHLVPNAVDKSMFYPEKKPDPRSTVFCTMYSKRRFKGFDVTISAFLHAKKTRPDIQLIIFGREDIARHTSIEGVTVLENPSQSQIRETYALSDGYVFSSRTEGFGLPILEALACGCPVIATKAGCAVDYIQPGKNGYLSEIDDMLNQSTAIQKIADMAHPERLTMRAHCIDSVKDVSWENSIKRFEDTVAS